MASLPSIDRKGAGFVESALLLVIDRDPHVRALERYFLEQAGYLIDVCADGKEAVERARHRLPVILVSEILVPGVDGLSVCRALKADPATRHILILIVSILAAEDRAREAGANGFLRKPVNDFLLISAVERLLAERPPGIVPTDPCPDPTC